MGRADTMVTWPRTRGSISMLRPVICDIAFTTACRSAPWKLSNTSPERGVTATAPGARPAGRAGGVGSGACAAGCSREGEPGWMGVSGVCAAASRTASALASASTAMAWDFFMTVVSIFWARPSAHVVIERLVATLALHLDQHALGAAELLVQLHHVFHAGERLAVHVADHVARPQAELLVQTARLDLAHQEASAGVGHDQGLAEELGPAELLLQLPPVDELPARGARLNDGLRSDDAGGRGSRSLGLLEIDRLPHAVAQDQDAVALHRVQRYTRGNFLASAERRLGLPLHDQQRTAARGAHRDPGHRDVQVGRRDRSEERRVGKEW